MLLEYLPLQDAGFLDVMSAGVGCWEASRAAAHAPRKNSPSGDLSLPMKAFVAEKEVVTLDGLECTEEAQIRRQVVRHSLPRRIHVWFMRGLLYQHAHPGPSMEVWEVKDLSMYVPLTPSMPPPGTLGPSNVYLSEWCHTVFSLLPSFVSDSDIFCCSN